MLTQENYFKGKRLPYVLLFPQLLIIFIFFLWPSIVSVKQSLYQSDVFGLQSHFVGFETFVRLFSESHYRHVLMNSIVYSTWVSVILLSVGLFLSVILQPR